MQDETMFSGIEIQGKNLLIFSKKFQADLKNILCFSRIKKNKYILRGIISMRLETCYFTYKH